MHNLLAYALAFLEKQMLAKQYFSQKESQIKMLLILFIHLARAFE